MARSSNALKARLWAEPEPPHRLGMPDALALGHMTRAPSVWLGPKSTESIMHLLAFLLFGLVIGLIARAIMPGAQRMTALTTMALGCAGSLVGGLLATVLFGGRWDQPITAGWIGSILGSLLVLALVGGRRRALF
jgi:uncharacterized membrane protein YeaQ/YmgE (transglycosylase-associated protein family)